MNYKRCSFNWKIEFLVERDCFEFLVFNDVCEYCVYLFLDFAEFLYVFYLYMTKVNEGFIN